MKSSKKADGTVKITRGSAMRFKLGDPVDLPLSFGTIMSPPAIEMFRESRNHKARLVVTKVDRKRGKITLESKP